MVKQYPYTLQVFQSPTAGKDANGHWVAGSTAGWVNVSRCRDEDGRGRKVAVQDGNLREYSFLIQVPKGVEAIAAGTKVRVMDGVTQRILGVVLYSRKGQLHTQIWV